MPRKPLIRTRDYPYHVTARVNNREKFPIELEKIWTILTDRLCEASLIHGITVHAFVLMPNHVHLLLSTPVDDLGISMNRYISESTKDINRFSGRSGRIFGARYHCTLIKSAFQFACAYKYVYRNPVRARLVERVEDYPFSTLRGLIGEMHLPVPLYYPFNEKRLLVVPNEINEMVVWLNRPFRPEVREAIRKNLRNRVFDRLKTQAGWDVQDLIESLL